MLRFQLDILGSCWVTSRCAWHNVVFLVLADLHFSFVDYSSEEGGFPAGTPILLKAIEQGRTWLWLLSSQKVLIGTVNLAICGCPTSWNASRFLTPERRYEAGCGEVVVRAWDFARTLLVSSGGSMYQMKRVAYVWKLMFQNTATKSVSNVAVTLLMLIIWTLALLSFVFAHAVARRPAIVVKTTILYSRQWTVGPKSNKSPCWEVLLLNRVPDVWRHERSQAPNDRTFLAVNKLTTAFYGPASSFKHTLSAGEAGNRGNVALPKRSDTFGGFDNGKEPAHPRGRRLSAVERRRRMLPSPVVRSCAIRCCSADSPVLKYVAGCRSFRPKAASSSDAKPSKRNQLWPWPRSEAFVRNVQVSQVDNRQNMQCVVKQITYNISFWCGGLSGSWLRFEILWPIERDIVTNRFPAQLEGFHLYWWGIKLNLCSVKYLNSSQSDSKLSDLEQSKEDLSSSNRDSGFHSELAMSHGSHSSIPKAWVSVAHRHPS